MYPGSPVRPDSGEEARPLRVGLNLVYLVEDSGGTSRYAHALIPALLEQEPGMELTAFVNRDAPASLVNAPWSERLRWVRAPFGVGRVPWHLPYQQLVLPAAALVRRLDLVHGLANVVPLVAPGVRTVVTLHDVTWLHYPEALPSPARRQVMKALSIASARRADRVVTVSRAARDDAVDQIGLDRRSVDVIHHGIAEPPDGSITTPEYVLRERFGLGTERLVLCVAQKRVHKNLGALVRAVALLERDDVRLVVPGRPTAYEAELRRLAGALGVGDRVHLPDWVSEADLEGLYRAASCFVLPSLMEGFGLPVLEAMRRELPVACSDRSALREVAGDAALLFDPEDPGSVASAIRRLLGDDALAARLRRAGLERCQRYTWERTARETVASYRRALGNGA
jgi:glycosyltransferase involved in cell wall biosynthesis